MPPGRNPRRVKPVPPRQPKGKPQPAYVDLSKATGVKIGPKGITATDPTSVAIEKAKTAKPLPSGPVIERQRLLKAQGYNVVVDGIWGAASQGAWSAYKKFGPKAPYVSAQTVETREHTAKGKAARAAIAAAREATKIDPGVAEYKRQQELLRDREKDMKVNAKRNEVILKNTIALATRIKADPAQARDLTLRKLTDVLTIRQNGAPIVEREGTLVLQNWLQQHGNPNLKIDGKYGAVTHAALEGAWRRAARVEKEVRLNQIRNDIYGANHLTPGEKAPWLPGGVVPTPEKLLAITSKGGHEATEIMMALQQFVRSPVKQYDNFKHAQLLSMASKLAPFGGAALANLIGPNFVSDEQLIGDLMSIRDMTIPGGATDVDVLAQNRYVSQVNKIMAGDGNPFDKAKLVAQLPVPKGMEPTGQQTKWRNRTNQQYLADLQGQVAALTGSSTLKEFEDKLLLLTQDSERKFAKIQQDMAAQSVPWWGKWLEHLMEPMEVANTVGEFYALRAVQSADYLLTGDRTKKVEIEDAMAVMGIESLPGFMGIDGVSNENYDGGFKMGNQNLVFASELILDPLNLFAPFKSIASVIRYAPLMFGGKLAIRAGGHALVDSELKFAGRRAWGTGDSPWQRAVTYNKKDWSYVKVTRLDRTGGYKYAAKVAERVTAQRQEAYAIAREHILNSQRRLHQDAAEKSPGAIKRLQNDAPVRVSPIMKRRIMREVRRMRGSIMEHQGLREMYEALKQDRVSLFGVSDRSEYSTVGAALVARYANWVDLQVRHRTADRYARQVFANTLRETQHTVTVRQILRKYNEAGDFAGAELTDVEKQFDLRWMDAGDKDFDWTSRSKARDALLRKHGVSEMEIAMFRQPKKPRPPKGQQTDEPLTTVGNIKHDTIKAGTNLDGTDSAAAKEFKGRYDAYLKDWNHYISFRNHALGLARKEYDSTLEKVGYFIAGAGDKALAAEVSKEVVPLIDEFENTILPVMQHMLEEDARATQKAAQKAANAIPKKKKGQPRKFGRNGKNILVYPPEGLPLGNNASLFLKDSKVTDKYGKPTIVYHGTGEDFAEFLMPETNGAFNQTGLLHGPGLYFTENPEIAGEYADAAVRSGDNKTHTVKSQFLAIKNPLDLDMKVDSGAGSFSHEDFLKGTEGLGSPGDFIRKRKIQVREVYRERWQNWLDHEGEDLAMYRNQAYIDRDADFERDLEGLIKNSPQTWDQWLDETFERLSSDGVEEFGGQAKPVNLGQVLNIFRDEFGDSTQTEWLRNAGYDGMTHIGGGRVARPDGKPDISHRVWIATSPHQALDVAKADTKTVFTAEGSRSVAQFEDHAPIEEPWQMFDENGIWSDAGGTADKNIRRLVSQSFDEGKLVPRPNPLWKVSHTSAEMADAVQAEVRKLSYRVLDNYARRKAVGENTGLAGDAIEKIKAEVQSHWAVGIDGGHYDTRQFLMVSDLYARHVDDLRQRGFSKWDSQYEDGVASLALSPWGKSPSSRALQAGSSQADDGIGRLAWDMGGSSRSPLLQKPQPSNPRFSARNVAASQGTHDDEAVQALLDQSDMLRANVQRMQAILAVAYDEAMPHEMMQRWAWWRALAEAQGAPGRVAYKTLNGALNTWIFATLTLRPGWVVRNQLDNTAKAILESVRDPRLLFSGAARPGSGFHSLFDIGIRDLQGAALFLDRNFGTEANDAFSKIVAEIWRIGHENIDRMFIAHNLHVPASVIETRFSDFLRGDGTRISRAGRPHVRPFEQSTGDPEIDEIIKDYGGEWTEDPESLSEKTLRRIAQSREAMIDMMGDRPEAYMRRVIYRAEFRKKKTHLTAVRDIMDRRNAASRELTVDVVSGRDVSKDQQRIREDAWRESAFLNTAADGLEEGRIVTVTPYLVNRRNPADGFHGEAALSMDDATHTDLWKKARAKDKEALKEWRAKVKTYTAAMQEKHPDWSVDQIANAMGKKTKRPRVTPYAEVWVTRENGVIVNIDYRGRYKGGRGGVSQNMRPKKQGVRYGTPNSPFTRDVGGHDHTGPMPQDRLPEADEAKFRAAIADHVSETEDMLHGAETFNMREAADKMRDQAEAINDEAIKKIAALQKEEGITTTPETFFDMTEAAIDMAAHDHAIAQVNKTLFDYSTITVIEDNFRFFFPFLQFWRKNTVFWAGQMIDKPWLPLSILKIEQEIQDRNTDLPGWMKRYTNIVSDAASRVPFLSDSLGILGLDNTQYDPTNFFSFAPYWRAFTDKSDNQNLSEDEKGMAFIAPFMDAVSDWGLGWNPFIRKGAESLHIANARAWQTVFPQTAVAVALTRKWWGERAAERVANWERIFTLMQDNDNTPADQIAKDFDFWVQTEMAGQVERGETPSRKAAEKTIEDWFVLKNLWGYFTGMYVRRANPQDIILSKMYDDVLTGQREYIDLSPKEKQLYEMWKMRGADRLAFNRYLETLPMVEAYYRQPNYAAGEKLKQQHPEIVQYVDQAFKGKPFSDNYLSKAQMVMDTDAYFQMTEMADTLDLPYEDKQLVNNYFLTPALQAFWDANDTPAQWKQQQIRAVKYQMESELNDIYHAIPDSDYDAKSEFIDGHPTLSRFWNRANQNSDDYMTLMNSANADLRSMYFAAMDKGGFDLALPILKAHPFMFERTKSEDKVDEATGEWKTKFKGHAASGRYYRANKKEIQAFFDLLHKVGKDAAFKWLRESTSKQAAIVREFFDKYGKHSAKQVAYLAAKKWLDLFYDMPEADRYEWLHGGSEGAALVQNFFDKYGNKTGEHGQEYAKMKPLLDYYGSLTAAQKKAWLASDDPDAQAVLSYFKKYGKQHQMGRAFAETNPEMAGTPEMRRRLVFWKQYFALPPDQRNAYVAKEADNHGIFVYGFFGDQENHDAEMAWQRRAVALGLKGQQLDYLHVKPLLDFYAEMPEDGKQLFLEANPELQQYFDKYKSDESLTGNKATDKSVEDYFLLPDDSAARSAFLKAHPDVQAYFDGKSTPAERAIRNLLDKFFQLTPLERRAFKQAHPEIDAYFNARKDERALSQSALSAFDQADPRLSPYWQEGEDLIRAGALMRKKLRDQAMKALRDGTLESRRDERRPVDSGV